MKIIALIAIFLCATASAHTIQSKFEKESMKDLGEVVEGFFIGFFEGEFPIQDCINDSEAMIEDFKKTVFYLKEGVTVEHVGEALQYIGDALQKLPHAIDDCKSCIGIIDKLKAIPEIFANPLLKLAKVGKNVFWHRKEIT